MTVVLVQRNGVRATMDVARPEMTIRLQTTRSSQDFELFSVDFECKLVYVEKPR